MAAIDELQAKHAAFVRELVVDNNQTQAAIRAGYSEKSAHVTAARLLKNAKVQAALEELRAELARETQLDATWVLTNLKTVVEHAMDAVPVLDMKGNPTGMWRFDSTGANKALELIGKHLGMFKDKLQVEVKKTHEEALSELE